MEAALDALGYDMEKQLWLLVYSLLLGAVLGALFDVFRISRVFITVDAKARAVKAASEAFSAVISFIEDILFFVISAICVVLFCFQANRGTARGFILVGIALGFILYLQTIGRLTKLISAALSRLLWSMIGFAAEKLIKPTLRAVIRAARFIYRSTLGRAAAAVLLIWHRNNTERVRARLIRECLDMFSQTKGIRDEPGTDVYTGKARNTPRVPVYDNHSRQRPDTLQQPGGRTGKVKRAH